MFEKLYRNNPAVGTATEPNADVTSAVFGSTAVTQPSAGRNRNGFFISDVQKLPGNNEIMASYTHSGKSDRPDGYDDAANMFAIGARHHFNKWMSVYAVYAEDKNHQAGHYGLGESGHGIPVSPSKTAVQTFKAFSVGSTATSKKLAEC